MNSPLIVYGELQNVSLNPKKSFWLGRKPLRIPESMALSKEKVTGRPCFLNPTSAAGDSYAVGSICKRLWVNTVIGDPTSLLHSLRMACCGQCFSADQFPPEISKDVVVFLGRKRVIRMSVLVPEISPLFISSQGIRPLGVNAYYNNNNNNNKIGLTFR